MRPRDFPAPFRLVFPNGDAAASPDAPEGRSWEPSPEEGQLSVDVIDCVRDLLVAAPMAGTAPASIEVYIQNDLLTIRGRRARPASGASETPLHQECFWGKFSRSIVLPVHVKADLARAEYKNGVLSIRIPKRRADAQIQVNIVDE